MCVYHITSIYTVYYELRENSASSVPKRVLQYKHTFKHISQKEIYQQRLKSLTNEWKQKNYRIPHDRHKQHWKTVTIGILYSENKLMKTLHVSPWPIELYRRIHHASYRRLVKSQFRTKILQHKSLHIIQYKLPWDYDTNITPLGHSMTYVTVTRKKLWDTIAITSSLRRQYVQELAKVLENDGKYPKGKLIRQLMAIEKMRKTHVSISFNMRPILKSRLKHIEVHKDFTDWNNTPKFKTRQWDTIIDLERIEGKSISRNRQYLGQ